MYIYICECMLYLCVYVYIYWKYTHELFHFAGEFNFCHYKMTLMISHNPFLP